MTKTNTHDTIVKIAQLAKRNGYKVELSKNCITITRAKDNQLLQVSWFGTEPTKGNTKLIGYCGLIDQVNDLIPW